MRSRTLSSSCAVRLPVTSPGRTCESMAALYQLCKTSISEVCVNQTEYRVHGVRVERFLPLTPVQGPPPIVFVHGGGPGGWSWGPFLPHFAQAGWGCRALNGFGHNGCAPHPEVGLLQRGIAAVNDDVAHV